MSGSIRLVMVRLFMFLSVRIYKALLIKQNYSLITCILYTFYYLLSFKRVFVLPIAMIHNINMCTKLHHEIN
jgi:hypothetical protein